MNKINVLSLCDGMSLAQICLKQANIEVENYFASEIKDIAIKHTMLNFPNTIEIGDVNKVHYENGTLFTENGQYNIKFDLVVFGSPCQSFSNAMPKHMKTGLNDKIRSGLFYECCRILKEVNPKYFLMENVKMNNNDKIIILVLSYFSTFISY